ncbi:MAG: serine hydroxymethyltransferase [Bacteriovoracaceae bacterium]|nr:serine hydroxymethyltransferase [Bacteriovoracaceae bacterium]
MLHKNSHSLKSMDPEIFNIIGLEDTRQETGIELIASENYCSQAVMEAQGSILTNKYAEGYPNKRYYGGCIYVDQIEALAISRLKKIFGAEYANVQPHSGSQANMAVYFAVLNHGDKILGMDLSQGGHLTHGSPVNFSGKLFQAIHYGLDPKTETIDYNKVREIAQKEKPKMIIAGASAYPRFIDFKIFADIAKEVGATLFVDMAHIAGLVAAGVHPSPIPYADVVTSTTHKTLRGPRGGIILSKDKEQWEKKLNSNIFPGIQGGPLEHVIAAKAVCFHEALQPEFVDYQKQVVKNAKIMADTLSKEGIEIVSGGTDNHLVLVKTDSFGMSGKEAEEFLEKIHVTCNKNMVPGDKRSPFVTSGIRLGTPAITTRGMKENQTKELTQMMIQGLKDPKNEKLISKLKNNVGELCKSFPVYKK